MKKSQRIACLFLVSSWLASSSALAQPAPAKLKMGILPYISGAVLQIAHDEGYFREQGLDVEIVPCRSSSEMLTLLMRGDLDAGSTNVNAALFNAVASGSRIKLAMPLSVVSVLPQPAYAFVARKGDVASGRFSSPASWKGVKITLTPGWPTGSVGLSLDRYLSQAGLSADDMITLTVDPEVQGDALASGQLDIIWAAEPQVTRLISRGDLAILAPIEPLVVGQVFSAVVYGSRLLADKDVGIRFAAAFIKGARTYKKGKTASNIAIVEKLTGLDESLVRGMAWSDTSVSGRMDTRPVQELQEWLLKKGLIDRIILPGEYLDESYAIAAAKLMK